MEEIMLVGYHGTLSKNIDSICKSNFSINNDDKNTLFLGKGIYFFTQHSDAWDWNIKKYSDFNLHHLPTYEQLIKTYGVVKSVIYVEKNDILDLDNKETLMKFESLISKFYGKLSTTQLYRIAQNKSAAIINMMYSRGHITKKVLMKTFVEQINTKYLHSFKNYSRKMFCIKINNIIKENNRLENLSKECYESIIYFYE